MDLIYITLKNNMLTLSNVNLNNRILFKYLTGFH